MKNILIIGSLMLSSALFAQNEAKQLNPKWEKGVISEYTGSYHYLGHDVNDSDVRTYFSFDMDFEIVQEEKERFIIRSKVPNLVLIEALKLANNSRADFSPFEEVNIYYAYNKTTGNTELLNWETLTQIYTEAKSEMGKYVTYYPAKQMRLESLFKELDVIFKDQSLIAKAYTEQINWFTSFFKKNLVLDKPATSNLKLTNPFFNDEIVKGSSVSTVNEINKETKSFAFTKDINIKDSYYKSILVNDLKDKESKKLISDKEKEKLKSIALTTYKTNFMEYGVINYETTLPVSLKMEYILDETSSNKEIRTYKRIISLSEKK